ncbi:hypothetical protein [Acinetobacter sp. ANC 4779]|uniref:hypothetical protein n=1 Tax=Acinetobacter sp. ANC 4779 TaxID=2529848 RepID=UPI0013F14BE5|nr:hypothetical protein [Acinetobacter sp. ANC 4779]
MSDIRYLDENMLMMNSGLTIYMNGVVLDRINRRAEHGSENIQIAKAGLKI